MLNSHSNIDVETSGFECICLWYFAHVEFLKQPYLCFNHIFIAWCLSWTGVFVAEFDDWVLWYKCKQSLTRVESL